MESRACSAVCSACGVDGVPGSCAEGNCADTPGSGTHTSTAQPVTAAGETPSAEAINRQGRSLRHVAVLVVANTSQNLNFQVTLHFYYPL